MSQDPQTRQGDDGDVEVRTIAQLEWATSRFIDAVRRIEAGDGLGKAEFRRVLARLRESLGLVLKERSIVAEQRRLRSGGARDGADLDLESARAEIGRRLDRIRQRGGAEELS